MEKVWSDFAYKATHDFLYRGTTIGILWISTDIWNDQ